MGGLSRNERLRGKSNFALFNRSKQFYGKYVRIAVIKSPHYASYIKSSGAQSNLKANSGKTTSVVDKILEENTIELCDRKVAFVVSKKITPLAVDRNRFKRRMREIYRHNRNLLPQNIWLMIIALPRVKDANYKELESDFKKVCDNITSKEYTDFNSKTL